MILFAEREACAKTSPVYCLSPECRGGGVGGGVEDVVGLLALHCRAVSLLQNEITLENFVHKPKSHNNIVKHIEPH